MATWIGSAGVSLLLLAFFLNLFRWTPSESYLYVSLNLAGAGLACWSSWLIDFMPFVVLEATWAVVALAALLRKAGGRPCPAPRGVGMNTRFIVSAAERLPHA